MRIGVLGTGMVGRAISGKLAELGHDVRVGSRTAGEGKVEFADAAAHGELVFNCTSGAASLDALTAAGADNLDGKVLIDVANPLDFSGRRAGACSRPARRASGSGSRPRSRTPAWSRR